MYLNWLNIIELGALTLLAGVTVRLTFLAYYSGISGNKVMLKALCRLIGVSVVSLNIGSFMIGFDVSARCRVDVEILKQEVQELASNKPSVNVLDKSDLALWSVITPAGTQITWRNEDGLRTGTSDISERNVSGQYSGSSVRRSNSDSSVQYGGINVSPNELNRL